jgi:hypothetical protein
VEFINDNPREVVTRFCSGFIVLSREGISTVLALDLPHDPLSFLHELPDSFFSSLHFSSLDQFHRSNVCHTTAGLGHCPFFAPLPLSTNPESGRCPEDAWTCQVSVDIGLLEGKERERQKDELMKRTSGLYIVVVQKNKK